MKQPTTSESSPGTQDGHKKHNGNSNMNEGKMQYSSGERRSKESLVKFVHSLNLELSEGEESDSSIDSTDLADLYLKYTQKRTPESGKASQELHPADHIDIITGDKYAGRKIGSNDVSSGTVVDGKKEAGADRKGAINGVKEDADSDRNSHGPTLPSAQDPRPELGAGSQLTSYPDARFPQEEGQERNTDTKADSGPEDNLSITFCPKVTVFDPERSWSQEQLGLALRRLEGNQDMYFSPSVGSSAQQHQDLEEDQSSVSALRWQLTLHRTAFREEILRLGRELRAFKLVCAKEVKRCAKKTDKHKTDMETEINELSQELVKKRLQVQTEQKLAMLDQGGMLLEQEKTLVDLEEELKRREQEAVQRQIRLEQFIQEVKEAEEYLDRRLEMTKLKQGQVEDLNQEIKELRVNLKEEKQRHTDISATADPDMEERKKKAEKNWNLMTSSLVDEKTILKSALKKAKSDQVETENRVTQLKHRVLELERQTEKKDIRIREMDRQLRLAMVQISRPRAREDYLHTLSSIETDHQSSVAGTSTISGLDTVTSSSSSLNYYTGHAKPTLHKTRSYPLDSTFSGTKLPGSPSGKEQHFLHNKPTSQTCAVM